MELMTKREFETGRDYYLEHRTSYVTVFLLDSPPVASALPTNS